MFRISFSSLTGPYLAPLSRQSDVRGTFFKIYESEKTELISDLPFSFSLSENRFAGTLRGLHFQVYPHEEIKFITCVAGDVYHVILDLRPNSPNFGNWASVELSSNNPKQLIIPKGFAHGYQTLSNNSTVAYLIWGRYNLQSSRRIAYNDKNLGIIWPLPISHISQEDTNAPTFEEVFLNHD